MLKLFSGLIMRNNRKIFFAPFFYVYYLISSLLSSSFPHSLHWIGYQNGLNYLSQKKGDEGWECNKNLYLFHVRGLWLNFPLLIDIKIHARQINWCIILTTPAGNCIYKAQWSDMSSECIIRKFLEIWP